MGKPVETRSFGLHRCLDNTGLSRDGRQACVTMCGTPVTGAGEVAAAAARLLASDCLVRQAVLDGVQRARQVRHQHLRAQGSWIEP